MSFTFYPFLSIAWNLILSGGEDFEPDISDEQKKNKQKNLYETFVKERDIEERGLSTEDKNKPRQGLFK